MTFTEQEALDKKNWISIAGRVVAGEFDEQVMSKVRKITKRTPPSGSMAEALIIGLRSYKDHPLVSDALDHIRNPE